MERLSNIEVVVLDIDVVIAVAAYLDSEEKSGKWMVPVVYYLHMNAAVVPKG